VQLSDVHISGSKSGGRTRFLPANDPTVLKLQSAKYTVKATARIYHANTGTLLGSAAQVNTPVQIDRRAQAMLI